MKTSMVTVDHHTKAFFALMVHQKILQPSFFCCGWRQGQGRWDRTDLFIHRCLHTCHLFPLGEYIGFSVRTHASKQASTRARTHTHNRLTAYSKQEIWFSEQMAGSSQKRLNRLLFSQERKEQA